MSEEAMNSDAAMRARDALLNAIAQQARELSGQQGQASKALEELSRAYANVLAVPATSGDSGIKVVPIAPQVQATGGSLQVNPASPVQSEHPSTEPEALAATENKPQVQTRAGGHQVGLCLELEP